MDPQKNEIPWKEFVKNTKIIQKIETKILIVRKWGSDEMIEPVSGKGIKMVKFAEHAYTGR